MPADTQPAAPAPSCAYSDLDRRDAYAAIFLSNDDRQRDRKVWAAATDAQQLNASDNVHRMRGGTNRYRIVCGLPMI